jgi:hypothetical protein
MWKMTVKRHRLNLERGPEGIQLKKQASLPDIATQVSTEQEIIQGKAVGHAG